MQEMLPEVLGTVITGLLIYAVRLFRVKVLKDIEDTEIRGIIDDISCSAEDVVEELNQTVVKKLRGKAGQWVAKEKVVAGNLAVERVKNIVGPTRLEKLQKVTGTSPVRRIRAAVESSVKRLKD